MLQSRPPHDKGDGAPEDDGDPPEIGLPHPVPILWPGDHQQGADDGDPGEGRDTRPAPGGRQTDQDDRPDEVEVLLDRERPRVLEQWRVMPGVDPPVGHVEQSSGSCRHDGLEAARHRRKGQDANHQHDERRDEPQRPTNVERPEVDRSRTRPLTEEERGDEEAAQRKEDIHARKSIARPR